MGRICGPGDAKGTTARGVTNSTINITTLSDQGNTVSPGIGHEFFETGDAFVKWCNAAGGIDGRQIVLHKRDAKLFNGGAKIIEACQTDFMEVGGGTALDDATVKPRLACKLGDIPAYHVSPAAVQAPLQVQVEGAAPPGQAPLGGWHALARQNPALKDHAGIYVSNVATVVPQAELVKKGAVQAGFTVNDFQIFPVSLANWRPYFENSKRAGTRLLFGTSIPNYTTMLAGMVDVGFKPDAVLFSSEAYKHDVIGAVANASVPVYVQLNALPFELANQVPIVQQAVNLLTTTTSRQNLSSFSLYSLGAWLLWAQSASACGSHLTVDCVLQKAGSHPNYDAGGLIGRVNTDPAKLSFSDCVTIVEATKSGFVYRKDLTQPNDGFFNCDPKNVAKGLPNS